MNVKRKLRLFVYSIGIFVCYSFYAIIQERITKGKYVIKPGEEENFTYMMSLVCVQCITNYLYASILSKTCMPQGENVTSSFYLASSALTYLIAMVCSNMALQWVNYPTQVIGKSAKPIPVMILGVLLGNKSYPAQKYLFVLLVVFGVALFMFKDGKQSKNSESGFGFGEVLLVLALIMDGLTGAVQERMRGEYRTKSLHMMSSMNKWSVLFLGVCIVYTGELTEFIKFVSRHQNIIFELILFSITSALGQVFIFLMIEHFGALPCSIVTTTRKLFTVLVSILMFGNAISGRQWVGTFILFVGLFLDALFGKSHRRETADDNNNPQFCPEDNLSRAEDSSSSGSSDEESGSCNDASDRLAVTAASKEQPYKAIVDATLMRTPPSGILGSWEKHTKGIGSRLMEKMGYIHGSGLGRNGEGITEPVDAVVLPAGKSLDHCMALREAAGGDKDMFKAERHRVKMQLRDEKRREKEYQRQKKKKNDVFSFLNSTLAPGINDGDKQEETSTSGGGSSSRVVQPSGRQLNIEQVQVEEQMRRVERDLDQLRQALNRQEAGTTAHRLAAARVAAAETDLVRLQGSQQAIATQQTRSKERHKMSVF